ncbi:amino acid/amide ABC transporter membrane protein 1, HAAT family [Roseovarius nanhaiticus]|uniref:Amino acid/amide ABC transporter membrane protein 1, HAAT family n=1 Tax=Roseovarius nanhaiticus TaxID=573024 RepID=A0A1N7H811_9RHOB|nr:branched-chain amino acid ABC transporter permease [Roseovarius nanhaiticus]SEL09765.1 amino acid/amide ABC transporter membrane protein 1, HAAT family [Roseovarius nanhaiticus]SIS20913.1 amino acid/amide ABC transporter membrane protein 1, HAAT family [Roseovarius nanhaiticus]
MTELLGIPIAVLSGQLVLGLFNGAFYALLSLGLAVIFGLLRVINFAHGALYMAGAFTAYLLGIWLGLPFWAMLIVAPLIVGAFAIVIERVMLTRLYGLDPLYGLLLTFGVALVIEGMAQYIFGVASRPFPQPPGLSGVTLWNGILLPHYRVFVIVVSVVVCLGTWALIERTRLGALLRAATENRPLVEAFGVNVPVLLTATYAFGAILAAFAGVMAAPVFQVSAFMGSNLVIVVFAVVVIGGMGSIGGAIVSGFLLGLAEGITKIVFPEASNVIVFVIMAIVLFFRPAGLFGKAV